MAISNSEIKRIRSLSQKKFRDELGLFVVEGEKMVEEALHSGLKVESVWYRDEIGEAAMSRISQFSTPSPVLAVLEKPVSGDLCAGTVPPGLYLGLDSLRDPGNLGTVMRIADWFGISAIFASEDTVDIYNPKTVQSTMGAIFRVRISYCSLTAAADRFLSCGGRVYGTFLDGNDLYTRELETGADSPVMIVIGNESNGISGAMAGRVSDRLLIPSYHTGGEGSESLNAAVAAAVTVAEFRRRLPR